MKIIVKESNVFPDEWFWEVVSRGRVVAESFSAYGNRRDAIRGATRFAQAVKRAGLLRIEV